MGPFSYYSRVEKGNEVPRPFGHKFDTRTIRQRTHLITDPYAKPTNTHQYLPPLTQLPPPPMQASIAYSPALRIRKICIKRDDYERWVGELKTYLVARGDNEGAVNRQIGKATEWNREDLLVSKAKNKEQVTPLVVTFLPDLPLQHAFFTTTNELLTHHRDYRVRYQSPPHSLLSSP